MALTITQNAGVNNSTSSSSSVATLASVTANVGDWLIACVHADNNGTNGATSYASLSDSAGNTWTLRANILQDPGAAAAGANLIVLTCPVTNALSSGTVTANFSPNTVAKSIAVHRVEPGVGEVVQFVSVDATGITGTSFSSLTTVSVTNGDTVFCFIAAETNAGYTGDADTTNGSWSSIMTATANTGTVATSMKGALQYKTVTGTATQTWNMTGAAVDFAATHMILRAAVTPAVFTGTSVVTFGQTGALAARSAHAGTSAIAFSQTGALKGGSAETGTAAIAFNQTGALGLQAALAGTTPIVLGQSGDFVAGSSAGAANFTGTIITAFNQTGALAATSVHAGTSAFAFSQTGALRGGLTVAGTATLVFAQTGAFLATAAFVSTATITFGQSGDFTSQTPTPIVIHRPGTWDPRQEYERRQREDEEKRREIIERAWRIANGEIDPVTLEELPEPIPVDLTAIKAALAGMQAEQDRHVIETFVAEQMRLHEDKAIAVLLLA